MKNKNVENSSENFKQHSGVPGLIFNSVLNVNDWRLGYELREVIGQRLKHMLQWE